MLKLTKISFILLLICSIKANKTIEVLEKLINEQKEEFDYKLNTAIKVQEIYIRRIEEITKQISASSKRDEFMTADSPCGDWKPYKDEKCFKVLDKVGTEEEGEKICSQQENRSTLITIHSKDEQDFLSNLLFKTHKVVDAVWIGAKYSSNKFKWADDSDLSFTNWDNGSPSNTADKACVQLKSEGSSIGKWANIPCNKKNLVVCQKMQIWSLSFMQKTVFDARKELNNTLEHLRKQINNQQSTINSQQSAINMHKYTIDNLKQNPVPIGFIYVQFPYQKSPTEIWPWMTWNDVSSAYDGVFFRVIGGEAASFGRVQQENAPHLESINVFYHKNRLYAGGVDKISAPIGGVSSISKGYSIKFIDYIMSGGEVRPRNMAIRIWKRT